MPRRARESLQEPFRDALGNLMTDYPSSVNALVSALAQRAAKSEPGHRMVVPAAAIASRRAVTR